MSFTIFSRARLALAALALLALGGCDVANKPYADEPGHGKVLYSSFQERPKYLDPVSSYNLNETPWVYAAYEPLLHYHYLKRPYTLEGMSATAMPEVHYLDKDGKALPNDAPPEQVATSVYTLKIRPGLMYQPHPALARDAAGKYLYDGLKPADINGKHSVMDFPLDKAATSTREATADDFVYQIKRLASSWVSTPSPVYNLLNQYIVGLKDLGDRLKDEHDAAIKTRPARDTWLPWHDLRNEPLSGVRALDAHTLEIRVNGVYPQFKYWMAMSFFVPIPWEADRFYAQRGMADNSIGFNTWPIGTGPFMLTEQGANRYIMRRNPNYHDERYPSEGMPGDAEAGLLKAAGKRMPFVDELAFYLEKEREPEISKLMQGYYDVPDLSRIDIAFALLAEQQDGSGRAPTIRDHGLQLIPTHDPSNWYIGFNMLDPVVGQGDTPEQAERNRKLRQALAIAIKWEEYCPIFFDKMGPCEIGMGPIPPGLFGHRTGKEGMNPYTHEWKDGQAVRRPLEEAKQLLAEAGYPDGRDSVTGKPLLLFIDSNGVGPNYQGEIDWRTKQFAKLGIQTEVRANDYNRFQDRLRKGNAQVYFWGWFADYPDPEDYLFLLTTSQGKVKHDGENASNYANPAFDKLYDRMKTLPDGPERLKVIDQMVEILRHDVPWTFGVFPGSVGIYQAWVGNAKPTGVINDKAKYFDIDTELRKQKLAQWNRPRFWPLGLGVLLFALLSWPALRLYRRREAASARQSRIAVASGSRK
jgi:ABC-type transport system substrate-binding protein